jgi:hypothetical protein
MDSRERFLATMHYGDRDRLFHWEMEPYEETVLRWRKEGLPADSDWAYFGGYDRFEVAPIRMGLCPMFERVILEKDEDYEIYRDYDGAVKKRLNNVPPPAMPQYIEFPLKGKEQWQQFHKRLNPDSPLRFPVHWESMKKQYANRDFPLGVPWCSIYGWLRNWMGVEGISIALYDDRAFIEQAAEEITDSILRILDKALDDVQYDFASFWEDMAYKTASLIDPKLYRSIFIPHYRRIVDRLHKAGIDILILDSDGNVEELIPCWLGIGINLIYPMEVAAGMDVVRLRKKFGKQLLMAGGMDKRVLAGDKRKIKQMVDEKIPLMCEGGYIPGIDHEIPPDIPWGNYIYYRNLMMNIKV